MYISAYILRDAWMGGGLGRELLLPRANGERHKAARNGEVERVSVPAL